MRGGANEEMVEMANMRAYDIMTKDVLTVTPDISKDEVRDLLFQHAVHGVPVVDDSGRLVGIVSVVDLPVSSERGSYTLWSTIR